MLPHLIHIAELTFDGAWSAPRHAHSGFCEMILITAGLVEVDSGGKVLRGNAGAAFVYPPEHLHQERALSPDGVRMFCLAWEPAREDQNSWATPREDKRGRMLPLLRWMLEMKPERSASAQQALDCVLQALLYEYTADTPATDDAMIARVKTYVQRHLEKPLCLEELAQVACMSKFHFARVFRQSVGMPPMAWVRQARVEAARNLLLTETLPLNAIAPRVGFADEYQLSRVFHQVTGLRPSAIRQSRDVKLA